MKLKSELTIIERAIQTIEEFSAVDERIRQQTILRGQSRSTFENYIRQIARICLHFDKLPEAICGTSVRDNITHKCAGRITLKCATRITHKCATKKHFHGAVILLTKHDTFISNDMNVPWQTLRLRCWN